VAAVLLVGLAAWLALTAALPHPVEVGVSTVVAARDLALGTTVAAGDLRVERRGAAERPEAALAEVGPAVGQILSGPVLAGEIVTPARFQGPAQLAGLSPGSVAVSLPVPDQVLLAMVRPADSVSVLAAGSGQLLSGTARVLATDLPASGGLPAVAATTGHLVVAVTPDEARTIAVALGPSGAPGGLLVALRR
jgi:Flp pilus assembly protein CpaB